MKSQSQRKRQTAAAIEARWGPETPEQRWQLKITSIIQFIARLGWATVELVNFYLGQVKRDWPAKMVNEKWIVSKIALIDDRPATILVLTKKAHRAVKETHPFIGRRINKEVSRQSRHDFIAAWVAVTALQAKYGQLQVQSQFTIWSDRVMRGYLHDKSVRPDISIKRDEKVVAYIEIERTRKTNTLEKYHFYKKLQEYQKDDIRTLVVFETKSNAIIFFEELREARDYGIAPWFYNAAANRWYQAANHEPEFFNLRLQIAVWNYNNKTITEIFLSTI